MSAIVAATGPRLSERTRRWVADATAYSANAGPDDQAVAFGRDWGLGHALLRTGLDGPDQPLTRDGSVWLSADVRLDSRAELRSRLLAHRQAVDADAGDPELLLAAYRAWGEAFIERLAGDFAFALWDQGRGRLLCGRDPLGVVPLHYTHADGELLVASALDALLLHPAVSDELDEAAVADFLVMGRGDFSATMFRAIRRVPPAHVASVAGRDVNLRRYWRPPEPRALVRFATPSEYVDRFRSLLETAVAERITTDRLAVQVSGGMDSTSVAAVARAIMNRRGLTGDALRGATMVLGAGTGDQEGHYAGLVAESLGLGLDIVDESTFPSINPFAEPAVRLPEPTPYRWTNMELESVRRCADHARLALTGLPGDALLMFVPWYWAEWLARGHLVALWQALADNRRLFAARLHPDPRRSGRRLLAALRRPGGPLPGWLAPDFAARTTAVSRPWAFEAMRSRDLDFRSIAGDPFWQTLFLWGDPTFTQLPLRLRHPLADLRLIDFVSGLAPEPWLVGKRILRDAVGDLLPDPVLSRRKTPLVRTRRASISREAVGGLAELARTLPEVDRFFDPNALLEAILAPEAAVVHPHDHRLMRALGLIYWRAHWRRPDASEVHGAGVRSAANFDTEEGLDERSTSAGSDVSG